MTKSKKPECMSDVFPPDIYQRNKYGLLNDMTYKFRDDGTIDWRAMIRSEFTVLNQQMINEIQNKYQKQPKDIKVEEVEDKYLLVLLAGFKELASLRGYTSVTYHIAAAIPNYAATSCRIEWIPNYETHGEKLIFESMADASPETTRDFGQNYLLAMAENRAFSRCVRNSLGIHVCGFDEVGPKILPPKPKDAAIHTMLQSVLSQKNISLGKLKEGWIKLGNDENIVKKWNSIEDIPSEVAFAMIGRMKGV